MPPFTSSFAARVVEAGFALDTSTEFGRGWREGIAGHDDSYKSIFRKLCN